MAGIRSTCPKLYDEQEADEVLLRASSQAKTYSENANGSPPISRPVPYSKQSGERRLIVQQ